MEQPELPYMVKLQVFEGPLDLLLHLIKKNEMDIYDIPIAKITDQYIEYLEFLKTVNFEFIGDYLALMAELGYIKSRMLLPQIKDEDEEIEDPRAELMKHLLEYERYKDAAEDLNGLDVLGREIFLRGSSQKEIFGESLQETEYVKTEIWSLIGAFREIYESNKSSYKENLLFPTDTISIEDRCEQLLTLLKKRKKIGFYEIFQKDKSKSQFVITFLSILELVKSGVFNIVQNSFNDEIKIHYLDEK